jgi:hypothetical protein
MSGQLHAQATSSPGTEFIIAFWLGIWCHRTDFMALMWNEIVLFCWIYKHRLLSFSQAVSVLSELPRLICYRPIIDPLNKSGNCALWGTLAFQWCNLCLNAYVVVGIVWCKVWLRVKAFFHLCLSWLLLRPVMYQCYSRPFLCSSVEHQFC